MNTSIIMAEDEKLYEIPKLDINRVDILGWTDAHHISYGSSITTINGNEIIIPKEKCKEFLKQLNDDTYLCIKNDYGQIALHLAIREDNYDVINYYIEKKIPCFNYGNKDGDTPLHYAAAWGKKIGTIMLLNGGANPTIQNNKGNTPMDDAITYGYKDIYLIMYDSINKDKDL